MPERKVARNIREHFDNIADYIGQLVFTEADLRQWKRILEERKYWLKERGIDCAFVLAPSKALVYQEYLPTPLQIWAHREFMELLGLPVQLHKNEHYVVMKPKKQQAQLHRVWFSHQHNSPEFCVT